MIGSRFKGYWWAALAACWCYSGSVRAIDYETIPLACLVVRADTIAVAHLPDRTSSYAYEVSISQVLKGDVPVGPLQVDEPTRWQGETPQFKTREALLFLKRKPNEVWEVWGPSGEGRIPLDLNLANVSAISLPLPGATDTYPRELLLDAVRNAARCFTFEASDRLIFPKSRWETAQMEQAMARSDLQRTLFQSLLDARQLGLRCPL